MDPNLKLSKLDACASLDEIVRLCADEELCFKEEVFQRLSSRLICALLLNKRTIQLVNSKGVVKYTLKGSMDDVLLQELQLIGSLPFVKKKISRKSIEQDFMWLGQDIPLTFINLTKDRIPFDVAQISLQSVLRKNMSSEVYDYARVIVEEGKIQYVIERLIEGIRRVNNEIFMQANFPTSIEMLRKDIARLGD